MKFLKWGVLAGLMFSFAASAFAERHYGMAGCGLGSMIMPKKGKFQQILAGTSNVYALQTSAVSSGTSNCKPDDATAAVMKQESFVTNNLSTLSKEMAQGEGQALAGLSETLGCSVENAPVVNESLRANYSKVFSAPGAVAVLNAAKDALRTNPALASSCRYLNI